MIELIMVIVTMSILAAVALPKFTDVQTNARVATLKSAVGAVNAAIGIAHSQAIIDNKLDALGTVKLENGTVNLVYGYPAATVAGIINAVTLSSIDFDTATNGLIKLKKAATPGSTCAIAYVAATVGTPAAIDPDNGDVTPAVPAAPATAIATYTGC
jgi:MSHA pilin protein MshA